MSSLPYSLHSFSFPFFSLQDYSFFSTEFPSSLPVSPLISNIIFSLISFVHNLPFLFSLQFSWNFFSMLFISSFFLFIFNINVILCSVSYLFPSWCTYFFSVPVLNFLSLNLFFTFILKHTTKKSNEKDQKCNKIKIKILILPVSFHKSNWQLIYFEYSTLTTLNY